MGFHAQYFSVQLFLVPIGLVSAPAGLFPCFRTHYSQHLRCQTVLLQPVAKAQDCALIGQSRGARIKLGELTKQDHVVKGFLHGRIRQVKPLLHEMNAQHGGSW